MIGMRMPLGPAKDIINGRIYKGLSSESFKKRVKRELAESWLCPTGEMRIANQDDNIYLCL